MENQGRTATLVIIAFLAVVTAFGVLSDIRAGTPAGSWITRIVLTGGLCLALWHGFIWAQWLTATLLLGGAGLLFTLAWQNGLSVFSAAVAISSVTFLVIGIGLVRSKALRAYAEALSERRRLARGHG